jgi:dienelactone hydrolase
MIGRLQRHIESHRIFIISGLILISFSCTKNEFASKTTSPNQNFTLPPDDENPPPKSSPPPPEDAGIDPSNGSGGSLQPGSSMTTSGGATIYLPTSYVIAKASPVIILFNMDVSQWKTIADRDRIVLVDTNSYNDVNLIFDRAEESQGLLESNYNVDRARSYFAGWSAGGNISIIYGTDPKNANSLAGIMVFPGSGGYYARNNLTAASQQGKRAVPIYYAVGDRDTSTGYYPGVLDEAEILSSITGYKNRIKTKIWPGVGHALKNQANEEAWQWIKAFNSKSN